jgi:hypothetical protein
MLESFKNLKAGKLSNVDNDKIFPLLRWVSGSQIDLEWCNVVNRYMFFVDKEIIKGLLYLGIRDKNIYIKYPKSLKVKEDKVFELKKELAKKYYRWSEQEFQRNLSNLSYIDWNEVLRALGCETKEYKILGIKEPKVTIAKPKKEIIAAKKSPKTLLDF